jgi:cholesterol oxidase
MHGLPVSRQTGARFGGNGEGACVAYATDRRTDIIGWGTRQSGASAQRLSVVPPGPTVVRRVQVKSDGPGGPLWIEDWSCPSAFVVTMQTMLATILGSVQDAAAQEKKMPLRLIDLDPFSSKPDEGALNHSMLYRTTGIEEPVGKFAMDAPWTEPNGRLKLVTPPATDLDRAAFDYIRQHAITLSPLSFISNVFWSFFSIGGRVLTEPLGSCPMAESVDSGVVNHRGQVFDSSGGVHPGLYVADASTIPAPLGTAPLLTVAALAERCAYLLQTDGVPKQ